MPQPTVSDIMTRAVVTTSPDTPFKEIVTALIEARVGALPVVDLTARPIGVIHESDVLAKLEFYCGTSTRPLLADSRTRARWHKSSGQTASDVMTTPATTILADAPLHTAVRNLAGEHTRLLCVVDRAGRMVGVLAPVDLLHLLLRSDAAIEADVERLVVGAHRRTVMIVVRASGGIVTLDGTVQLRSTVEQAKRATCRIPGVIAIHNNLRFEFDDVRIAEI